MPTIEIAKVTIKLKDKEIVFDAFPKEYSTGRQGFYARIPNTAVDGKVYSGQVMIWEATQKKS